MVPAIYIGPRSGAHWLTGSVSCRRMRAGILISTSRRTGPEGQEALKAALADRPNLVHGVWYDPVSPNVVTDYVAAADIVVCTEDSRSMISDAIAAGKCVYAVQPSLSTPTPRHARMLEEQAQLRRIKRISIADLGELDVDADIAKYFQPRTVCWSVGLINAIQRQVPRLSQMLAEHAPVLPFRVATSQEVARTIRE